MKYRLILTGKFKKSLKLAKKRGLDLSLIDSVINTLQQGLPLADKLFTGISRNISNNY